VSTRIAGVELQIAQTGGGFGERERKALLAILAPAANSQAASEVRGLMTR